MKNNNIVKLIFCVFLVCFINYSIFILINEFFHTYPFWLSFITLFITEVVYLINKKKIKKNINQLVYYIVFSISWTTTSIMIFLFIDFLDKSLIINLYGTWFRGLEYIILSFFFILAMFVSLIIDLIIYIYSNLSKKVVKNN